MGVIINEVEVVAEPEPQTAARQKNISQPDKQALTQSAHDIELVIRHQTERLTRVWAH